MTSILPLGMTPVPNRSITFRSQTYRAGTTSRSRSASEDDLAVPLRGNMVWVVLVIAGLFEIVWAIGLKYSEGFTRLWPSVVTLVSLGISMVLLGVSVRVLPLGTAYAVWTGIGAVGTAIVGMVLFREPATVGRIVCLALVIGGIAGLKVLGR